MSDLFIKKQINDDITAYFDKKFGFMEIHDRTDNTYIRKFRKTTNEESFRRSFPMTLSISIVGGCKARDACYLDCCAGKREYYPSKNMSFESFKKIIDEGSHKGLLDIILTGSGDPNDHPNFEQFVMYAKGKGLHITCNTTGYTMTPKTVNFFEKNINKVEFNLLYGEENSLSVFESLLSSNINVSLSILISSLTIDTATDFLRSGVLEFNEFGKNIRFRGNNAIGKLDSISLRLYKRKGLGMLCGCLTEERKDDIKSLISLLKKKKTFTNTLLEPCFNKLFTAVNKKPFEQIPSCECGRYTAYITENMVMLPCEFANVEMYGESLYDKSIEDVFNGKKFLSFREDYKCGLHCRLY